MVEMNDLKGYKQLVDALIEKYGIEPIHAIKLLDEALFDYDVIVNILNTVERNL